MSRLSGLVDAVVAEPVVAAAVEQAREPAASTLDLSAPPAIRPVLFAALAAAADHGGADRPVLAVTATFREAEDLTEALRCLVDDPATVAYYPAWETLPHERLSPRSDTVGRRLAVLRRLVHPDPADETTGPIRSARGQAGWPESTRSWPNCSRSSRRGTRSRAWSRWRRCWSTTWNC